MDSLQKFVQTHLSGILREMAIFRDEISSYSENYVLAAGEKLNARNERHRLTIRRACGALGETACLIFPDSVAKRARRSHTLAHAR